MPEASLKRHFLRVIPRAPMLIGGWSTDATADGASAHRQGHAKAIEYFVPGSALRGALRLAFEQVLRGAGQQGCAPEARSRGGAACSCRVCRLFGNVGRQGLVMIGPAICLEQQGGNLLP